MKQNFKTRVIFTVFFFMFVLLTAFGVQAGEKHFVFVHGAWHGSWVWVELLEEFGKDVHTTHLIELPGHGIDMTIPGTVTLQDYTDEVINYLDQISEPVILVGHSMGGIVISTAAEARPEKITALVYIAAFLVEDGQSLLYYGMQDTGSLAGPNLIINEPGGTIDINRGPIKEIFYEDCTEFFVNLAGTLLRPNPLAPFATPLSLTELNYGSVQKVYIKTLRDYAVTPWLQDLMLSLTPVNHLFSIDSDHSPFLSDPKSLKKILDDIALLY